MSRTEQINLVRSVVYRVTPEQAEAIADNCLAARAKGENASVWHQSSLYFRSGQNCQCAECCDARARVAA